MLKKNEVIEILENGGHIMVNEVYRTAHAYRANGTHPETVRYDTAERIGKMEGYTDKSCGAWTYTRRIEKDWDAISRRVQEATTAALRAFEDAGVIQDLQVEPLPVQAAQEAAQEQEPVYLEESWPTSNSVVGVHYELHTETSRASHCVIRYTVDDLQTAIQQARQNGEKITSCVRWAYDAETDTERQTPIIPETSQEKTDRENREHCKHISDELDLYVDGQVWQCPECGETFTEDHAPLDDEDVCICPHCQQPVSVHDLEQLSLWDYFSDVLDVDWILNSSREYKACRLLVAYGGPNIYIDTLSGYVELYWWTDTARYKLRSDTLAAIDEWAEEWFNC